MIRSSGRLAAALALMVCGCSGPDFRDGPKPGAAAQDGDAGPNGAGGAGSGGGNAGMGGAGEIAEAGSAGAAGAEDVDAGSAGAAGMGASAGAGGEPDAGSSGDAGFAASPPDAGDDGATATPDASAGGTGGAGGAGGTGGTAATGGAPADAGLPDAQPEAPEVCGTGWANCHGASGCQTHLASDLDNCGACDNACHAPANSHATCGLGACGFTCATGHGDCDGQPANGCEADLGSSLLHCTACGNACAPVQHGSPTCTPGGCSFVCAAGWGDCDGTAATGCEVDLTTTVAHCGGCGNTCPARANAQSTCASSTCGFACNTGFASCDGLDANGCEVSLSTDVSHCGTCNHACGTANGSPSCSGGTCSIQCNSGFANCDAANPNGCEVNLMSNVESCGACGFKCGTANGAPSCTAGACSIACAPGFADCDGFNGNGCEVNLGTDGANCGQCERDCLGAACGDGLCAPAAIGSSAAGIRDFDVVGSYLYRLEATRLLRYGKAGGMIGAVLADNLTAPGSLKIDGAAYWAEETLSGRILRAMMAPSTPAPPPTVTVSDAGALPHAIDYAGGWLYWIGSNTVLRGKSGVSPSALAFTDLTASRLVTDGLHVYWLLTSTNGAVERVSVTGGATTHIATGLNEPTDLAVDDTRVYWVNHGGGTVQSAPKNGGAPATLASGQTGPNRIALIGEHVYWTASDGTIRRSAKAGGGDFLLADGRVGPTVLRVDDSWVYWLEDGGKALMRVAR